ncbi:cytochrome c biogenesis ATP-binding export protein CcmA [Sphaerotilus microaerophilus]|uniref:Cytochrome c biogenesis ATP-binding export protein CcmA n=1 Tax=Sphaerotilus microaerophilus TaxID=2914710 RepID=A0ABM7YKP4_9BURK|nr:cytochrome c biogenesis ATP-binding export protein CcmA [Sphaerotilus sp. FB-5]
MARVSAERLTFAHPGVTVFADLGFTLSPGLTLVRGGDGRGKTTLLRLLAGELAPTGGTLSRRVGSLWWEQPGEPAHDAVVAREWLAERQAHFAGWRVDVAEALVEAFGLGEHLGKRMEMLSAGSRRKVGLVGAAASGATLTLLDTPWAALDARSARVLDELLAEAADDEARLWVVADHERPASLADVTWAGCIDLGD